MRSAALVEREHANVEDVSAAKHHLGRRLMMPHDKNEEVNDDDHGKRPYESGWTQLSHEVDSVSVPMSEWTWVV